DEGETGRVRDDDERVESDHGDSDGGSPCDSVSAEDGDGDSGLTPETGLDQTFLRVDGMHSSTCEAFLESVAESREGVVDAEASYVTETIRVRHDPDAISPATLRDALSTLGYTAYLREGATGGEERTARGDPQSSSATRQSREKAGLRKRRDDQILEFRYAAGLLFGAFLMVPYVAIIYPSQLAAVVDWGPLHLFEGAFRLSGPGGLVFLRIYGVLTGAVLVFTGLPVLRGAYVSLKLRRPNTELLVAATAVSAYVYSTAAVLLGRADVFYDLTVVVAASVTAATFYETSIKQRALDRLTDLTISQVGTARRDDQGGEPEAVPVEDLEAGDRVIVREGERVPVDGTLLTEACTVDEAIVTGESLPAVKRSGDRVRGGSVVTDDAAVVRVGDADASSLQRLTTAVWELQSADHGGTRRADRLAARVAGVVGVVAIAGGVAALLLGSDAAGAFLLTLLVVLIATPWAVGLAAPLSVATGLAAALRRGIVVFDETVLERLRSVDVVVFDKTGTLTTGEMEVVDAEAPPNLLAAAADLERLAVHPAASAIVDAYARDDERPVLDEGDTRDTAAAGRVRSFTSHVHGVEGVVDGERILLGNRDLFAERGWEVSDAIDSRASDAREFGRLPVVVGREGAAEGIVVVGDEPREGWDETVRWFGKRGVEVVVLTGDDQAATDFLREHEHVTHVFAGVPPGGKTAAIRRLGSRGQVAMVGDGVNDAPALAAADLGISLGGGTDLAADAADVTIADDAIGSVVTAFELARAAHRRGRQTLWLALGYNAIAIPAAVAGVFTPLTAALAVLVGGGLVVANSSRALLRSS
ncbi:MAG: heavy metal translocating P-type ATPase, partial [Haloferacaceae archaeon]